MFIKCNLCGKEWNDRKEFLLDPRVALIGYQVNFESSYLGFLLFNHNKEGCGTTISLEVEKFKDLTEKPVFEKKKFRLEECPGYCLYKDNMQLCPVQCECSFIREIIHIIHSREIHKS